MTNVLVRMLRNQLAFLLCILKWAAAKGGVGSGKTMAMVWWIIQRLEEYALANHVVVGADYDQLRRGFFPSLIGVLEEDLGFEAGRDYTYRENPTPMIRFLHSGARLRSMSAELAQRVRSAEFQTIYCEEPQTWHNGNGADTFRAVAGRLRHSRRSASLYPDMPLQGRMSFNPPAVGTWLYSLIEEQWKGEGYPCYTFSLRDNVLLPGLAEYIRQIEAMYPPDRWPVEIEGEWATIGGDVYRGFDLKLHAVKPPDGFPPVALDASKPILWALDFNVEWMSSVVCQAYEQPMIQTGMDLRPGKPPVPVYRQLVEGWQRHVIYCLDELFLHDAGTPDVVSAFVQRYGEIARRVGVYVYGDASGGARAQAITSQAAARSNWEIIINGLLAAGIRVKACVPNANPAERDRVNAVCAQFRTGEGVGFLVNSVTCPELIKDFQAVKWDPKTNKIDKKDASEEGLKRTHLSDALGYLIELHRRMTNGEQPVFRNFMER